MIVKKKENCREGGQRSWFIATFDFASLQARLASIDTFYNNYDDLPYNAFDKTHMPDKTLYEVYKDGSKVSDMHSMTGFGTFVDSIGMKAIRVHDDVNDKDYVFAANSKCKVRRGENEIVVKAEELQPFDHIIEHMK